MLKFLAKILINYKNILNIQFFYLLSFIAYYLFGFGFGFVFVLIGILLIFFDEDEDVVIN